MKSSKGKLIVVSNRLPNFLIKREDEVITEKSVGGLATALDSVLKNRNAIWIGHSGVNEEEFITHKDEINRWKTDHIYGFSAPDVIYNKFYDEHVCKYMWNVFHGNLFQGKFKPDNWQAFKRINELFMEQVLSYYEPGDTVWVNDFQLMLLPALLKNEDPTIRVGFFLHIPFPSPDIFEAMPHADELVKGVMASDIIGFHTKKYSDNFIFTAKRFHLPLVVDKVIVLPIGTDQSIFKGNYKPVKLFPDQRIILAAERMDWIKGIPERLKIYEDILEHHPELHKKVVLIQIAAASRGDNKHVEELVGRINGGFGTFDWTPVVYSNTGLTKRELAKLYRRADVLWVNSLIDGLNLVCKEYVASRIDNTGELILSQFAGSAEQMTGAVIINPYDTEGTAKTISKVLTKNLAGQQTTDMAKLRRAVDKDSSKKWANTFLQILKTV